MRTLALCISFIFPLILGAKETLSREATRGPAKTPHFDHATHDGTIGNLSDEKAERVKEGFIGHTTAFTAKRKIMGDVALTAAEQDLCAAPKCGTSFATLMKCIGTHKKIPKCLNAGIGPLSLAYEMIHQYNENHNRDQDAPFTDKELHAWYQNVMKNGTKAEKHVFEKTHFITGLSQLTEIERAIYLLQVVSLVHNHGALYDKAEEAMDRIADLIGLSAFERSEVKGKTRHAAKHVAATLRNIAAQKGSDIAEKGLTDLVHKLEDLVKKIENKDARKLASTAVSHIKCSKFLCGRFFAIAFECVVHTEEKGSSVKTKTAHKYCAGAAYNKLVTKYLALKQAKQAKPSAFTKKFDKLTDGQKIAFLEMLAWAADKAVYSPDGTKKNKHGAITKEKLSHWRNALAKPAHDLEAEAEQEEATTPTGSNDQDDEEDLR